jgi:hypothetical protein
MARQHQDKGDVADAAGADELRQSDLSHLRLQDMSPGQRAELRRRYNDFVRHFGRGGAASPRQAEANPTRLRKWVPGAKR